MAKAEDPKVGQRIMNDAGTCLKIVNTIEGETVEPGTVPAADVPRFMAAGYELVKEDQPIPVQQHQVDGTRD